MSNYSARSLRDLNIGTSYANVASFGQTIGAESDKRSASKPPKNQIDERATGVGAAAVCWL